MKKMMVLFAAIVCFNVKAQAGILLEPYMAYIMSSSSSSDSKLTGNEIGARVGYSMLGFGVGLDAVLAGTQNMESDAGDDTYKITSYGLFVGYKFPILFKVYATYVPSYKATGDLSTVTGTATKLGVQYTGLPFVALGLESQTISLTKFESDTLSGDLDEKTTLTSLTLSVPFDL